MDKNWAVLVAGLIAGVTFSCRQSPRTMEERSAPNAAQQIFAVKGTIKSLQPSQKLVTIEHEKIPDFMEAMTMDFAVRNTNELAGLSVGDYVSFRMIVQPKDAWIDQITRLNTSRPLANAPETFRRVRDVDPLNIGDPLPEYHFTNEMNQPVSFSDFKGQALGITFLFTRCPFPTFCPRMASNFDEALKKLKADPHAPTNWHLLTITFDPAFDTPPVLKSYAKRYTYDPAHWNYLTGELIDITAITEQFGLMFWRPDPNEVAGISHNLRTAVIDAEGRVQKVLTDNNWKVDDFVAEMLKAAAKKRQFDRAERNDR